MQHKCEAPTIIKFFFQLVKNAFGKLISRSDLMMHQKRRWQNSYKQDTLHQFSCPYRIYINWVPTPTFKEKSPYEILYNKLPAYEHFRIFGCLYYAAVPLPHKNKFSRKATSTKKFLISRDVHSFYINLVCHIFFINHNNSWGVSTAFILILIVIYVLFMLLSFRILSFVPRQYNWKWQ